MRIKWREERERRKLQSTRQLMGIQELTDCGVKTTKGEFAYYLIRPDNLSVLSAEGISGRVGALMGLLRSTKSVILRALDSRESFDQNKIWYQQRLEEETNPAIRELLKKDRAYLDQIQTLTTSAREFVLCVPVERQGGESVQSMLTNIEKTFSNGFQAVRLAGEQDIKRLLAVYYQQDVTTEYFESVDGERAVRERAENEKA